MSLYERLAGKPLGKKNKKGSAACSQISSNFPERQQAVCHAVRWLLTVLGTAAGIAINTSA